MNNPAHDQGLGPLLITVAPNGAYKTPADHPAVPITADAIAATARDCHRAGAAMIHLHVREADGRHSLDPALYAEAIGAVREAAGEGLWIQVTSEAGKRYKAAEQMAMMREVEADSMSLAIRELVPGEAAEDVAGRFFHEIVRRRVLPQYIVYSAEDLQHYQRLRDAGIIPDGPHMTLWVLGRYTAGQQSSPRDLLPFLAIHDGHAPWAVCAFGPQEHACTLAAAAFCGHVRVGFENNLYRMDQTLADNNAELVVQTARAAAALGRPLADRRWLEGLLGQE